MTLEEAVRNSALTTEPAAGPSQIEYGPRENQPRAPDEYAPANGHVVGSGEFVEDVALRVPSRRGDPAWEIADLFPRQGNWTEEAYLQLDTNRLIEFKDGVLEFLPMPSWIHQCIVRFLFLKLHGFVSRRDLGEAMFAPLRFSIREDLIREPDVLYVRKEDLPADRKKPQRGAGILMEVVSPGRESRERDFEAKRLDYAAANVPEYWIVDPETETITVLTLVDGAYVVHGEFRRGGKATSVVLRGFRVDVSECLDAGVGATE